MDRINFEHPFVLVTRLSRAGVSYLAPYRDPLARDAALGEIRRGCARGIYEPKIVESLMRPLG